MIQDSGSAAGEAIAGLRVGEVADLLDVSASTIRSWEQRYGIAPGARSPGGHRRYADEDVAQLRALRDLVQRGQGFGQRGAAPDDATGHSELLLAATRAVLRAVDPRGVRDAVLAYVHVVGGRTASPEEAGTDGLLLDLSFGEGDPVVAVAENPSVVRLRLETSLPALYEDARRVVGLLEAAAAG